MRNIHHDRSPHHYLPNLLLRSISGTGRKIDLLAIRIRPLDLRVFTTQLTALLIAEKKGSEVYANCISLAFKTYSGLQAENILRASFYLSEYTYTFLLHPCGHAAFIASMLNITHHFSLLYIYKYIYSTTRSNISLS